MYHISVIVTQRTGTGIRFCVATEPLTFSDSKYAFTDGIAIYATWEYFTSRNSLHT
jgi:hypothetical protein